MDFAALQHSVFLQSLGSAILNSLWQCFLLWIIYETVSVSYKAASAKFKNNLATLLLFFSFAWFLTSFVSKILLQHHIAFPPVIPGGMALESKVGNHAVWGISEFLTYVSASLPYLSVAYIFLLFFLIYRLFAAYRYVYFISNKRLMSPTGELQFFASGVAAEIGITKKIGVWISHHIDVPATIGFFKPVILIPLASINNLSAQQLEAIILHELAHIKRNDYIANLVISVIETILFFNPFVVLLSNIIKRERENCCDDFVLQYRYDPHSYASALLRLEQSRISRLKLAIGAVSGKKQLLSRIKRITNSQVVSRQFNYGQKIMALLLVTAIICSVAWLTPEEKKSATQKALAKSNPVSTANAKPAGKPQVAADVAVAGRSILNLPPLPGSKHALPKSEDSAPPAVEEGDNENAALNISTAEDNENSDESDQSGTGTNVDFSDLATIKQPIFSFDEKSFKLPQFVGIQKFLLQNMNLNIDPGKIDIEKLTKNLQQAYREINALDWSKVQNDIRESFVKMKAIKVSQKQQDANILAAAKALARVNLIKAPEMYTSKEILDQLENEMAHDSFHKFQITLPNIGNIKIQRVYNKLQRQYERDRNANGYQYYYKSSNERKAPVSYIDEAGTSPCDKKNTTVSKKETVEIKVRHARNDIQTGVLPTKKGFHFSFSNTNDEKPGHESIITVEINN